jgi:hypothetical protein
MDLRSRDSRRSPRNLIGRAERRDAQISNILEYCALHSRQTVLASQCVAVARLFFEIAAGAKWLGDSGQWLVMENDDVSCLWANGHAVELT